MIFRAHVCVSRDHNTQARLYNSFLTSCQQPLDAIKTLADAVPIGFPTNKARLATMSGVRKLPCIKVIDNADDFLADQLRAQSRAYNLSENGTADEQRRGLRRFIGVVREV